MTDAPHDVISQRTEELTRAMQTVLYHLAKGPSAREPAAEELPTQKLVWEPHLIMGYRASSAVSPLAQRLASIPQASAAVDAFIARCREEYALDERALAAVMAPVRSRQLRLTSLRESALPLVVEVDAVLTTWRRFPSALPVEAYEVGERTTRSLLLGEERDAMVLAQAFLSRSRSLLETHSRPARYDDAELVRIAVTKALDRLEFALMLQEARVSGW